MAIVPPVVIDWVADSDACNHTISDVGNLTSVCPSHINDPSFIIVGNRSSLPVTSVGDMTLLGPFYLNNVLVTPDIIQNLLSVRRFTTDNCCSIEFDPFGLYVKDLSTSNVITRCDSSRPLYTMRLPSRSTPLSYVAVPTALIASASTWHCRLGHPALTLCPSCPMLLASFFSRRTHDLCHACQLGRYIRISFVSSTSCADNNFDLIHCDL
jgi:hypothetical protein